MNRLLFVSLFILVACNVSSQNENYAFGQSGSNLIGIYQNGMQENANIYRGQIYDALNIPISDGSAFFDSTCTIGSVVYQGLIYEKLKLYYNIFLNQLISVTPRLNQWIVLDNAKIESFTIGSHTFENMKNKTGEKQKEGFYEILFADSKHENIVYKKYVKSLDQNLSGQIVTYILSTTTRYYIKKGEVVKEINKKSDILNLYSEKRDMIKKFIKESDDAGLNNMTSSLKDITKYYISLNK